MVSFFNKYIIPLSLLGCLSWHSKLVDQINYATTVGANRITTKSRPDDCVVGGVPPKVLKTFTR